MINAGNTNLITISHNGKEYVISKHRNIVFKAIRDKLKKENFEYAKEILNGFPPCKEREDLIKSVTKNLNESDVQEYVKTSEGFSYYLYLSAKVNHPNLTFDEFSDALTLDNMAIVSMALEAEGKRLGNIKPGEAPSS